MVEKNANKEEIMATPALSNELMAEAVRAFQRHNTKADAARSLGLNYRTYVNRLRRAQSCGFLGSYTGPPVRGGDGASLDDAPMPDGNGVTVHYGLDAGFLDYKGPRICSVDQLLELARVDLAVWDVERQLVNKWEVGAKKKVSDLKFDKGKISGRVQSDGELTVKQLIQVKVWLKRRIPSCVEEAFKRITERLPLAPRKVKYREPKGDFMLEIGLFDHHFGKLAWARETGQDYDLRIAEELYPKAVEELLGKARHYGISRIILPIGNDFFHIDNLENTTAKGTRQDVDTRLPKIFDAGAMSVIRSVDMLSQVAPVEVVWVPGNHDPLMGYFLAKYLDAYYRNNGRVQVDTGPKSRKRIVHGNVLIGYTHGDEEPHRDLPSIMATEWPHDFAATLFREWHVGHLHKAKETHYLAGDTYGGVQVKTFPSLSGTDAWHYRKGYVRATRTAEAHLYDKTGPAGTFYFHVS